MIGTALRGKIRIEAAIVEGRDPDPGRDPGPGQGQDPGRGRGRGNERGSEIGKKSQLQTQEMDGWSEMAEMFLLLEYDLSMTTKMLDQHHLSLNLVRFQSLLVELGYLSDLELRMVDFQLDQLRLMLDLQLPTSDLLHQLHRRTISILSVPRTVSIL